MLWIIVLFFFLLWFCILRWRQRKYIYLANQFKSSAICVPFLGHAYRLLGNDEERMTTLIKIGEEALEKGGIISHWQGNDLFLLIADPEPAEVILKTCLEKGETIKFLTPLLGNGSIFAPVPIWRPRRKIITPIFSQKNLNQFVGIFARQSKVLADKLQSIIDSKNFSIWNYLTGYTMDSVFETTLGSKVNAQLQPDHPFLRAFDACCRIDVARVCQPWLQVETFYRLLPCAIEHARSKKVIWNFINKIIEPKWAAFKAGDNSITNSNTGKGFKTFLELLIEASKNGREYTKIELREESLVIVLAGTDTSAVGTAFTIALLAKHPDVQDRVFKELQEVFGSSDRPVEASDLLKLKYMEAVIKESLRLYPPLPFIIRKVDKDIVLPSGVTVVEGCNIFVSIWAIHRNPKYWGEDAEMFKPERFVNSKLSHPASFLAFSHGPRSCLGYQYALMSIKTALATVLRKYRIREATPTSPYDIEKLKQKQLRVKFTVMMKDVDNFHIQLEYRS